MKVKSLSFKLTIWYMVILTIILFLGGFFLFERFKDGLMGDLEKKLKKIAGTTYDIWRSKRGITWQDAVNRSYERFKMCQPFIQAILIPGERKDEISSGNREFLHSDNIRGDQLHLSREIYKKARKQGRDNPLYVTARDQSLSPFPLRTVIYPAKNYAIIQVALSMENTINAQRRLFIILILAGPLLLLLTGIGGSFIIRRALLPVKSVVQAAKKISADDLSMRIESGGRRDEIGELVETFNRMIARLEGSVQRIRQFSADVSHELRTPLTIIRGEVEVILRKERSKKEYREILGSILEETQQVENIIDDLLLLSRVRSVHKKMIMEEFSLHESVERIVRKYIPAAAGKGIRIKPADIIPMTITGKRTLIERMISNVIDNALRYTRSGGSIDVTLQKGEEAVELTITDTGIGIPKEALPSIFDRFYVVGKSRSKENGGTGLGLAIVKWIADNHNIRIRVDSHPDQGTTFTFLFPNS
ncbi:MAG: HAMP domain-containing protein [Candidatus Aminicenantes bacterium]|nr:HAMP domain-containing protein [Candidatus Aminicenantes bacterium]